MLKQLFGGNGCASFFLDIVIDFDCREGAARRRRNDQGDLTHDDLLVMLQLFSSATETGFGFLSNNISQNPDIFGSRITVKCD
jgi:hypothetical protein